MNHGSLGVRLGLDVLAYATEPAEVARRFADRLGMPDEVARTLWGVFEQWDGTGLNRSWGDEIPLASRIIAVTSLVEAFHAVGGRTAAIRVAQARNGTVFDPVLVEAFLEVARDQAFWAGFEEESVWETVAAMDPPSPSRFLPQERLVDVAMAFADFADLKSFYAAGHSRRVGDLAVRIARRMLGESDADVVRLAGLPHDLGLVDCTACSRLLDQVLRIPVRGIAARERLRRQHNDSGRTGYGDRAVHRGRLHATHRPARLLAVDAAP